MIHAAARRVSSRMTPYIVIVLLIFGCTGDSTVPREVQFLEFYADWCDPCKEQNPIVDKLSEEFPGVVFRFVNVDQESEFAQEYQVKAIPCAVILVGGEVKRRSLGVQSYDTLYAVLDAYTSTTGTGNVVQAELRDCG